MAAIGFLTSCASYRPRVDTLDVSDRGQNERCLADCQNYAEPVSPGAWAIADVLSGVAPGAAARDRTGLLDTAGSGVLEAAMVGGACADGRIVRNFIGPQGCVVLG